MTTVLRVLIVSHSRGIWGSERITLQLAPLLRQRGIDLRLCSPPGDFSTQWLKAGLPYLSADLPEHRGIRDQTGEGRPSLRELGRELATVGHWATHLARLARSVDIVQSNSLSGHLETAIAGRLAHRPAVLHVHDLVRPGMGRRVLGAAVRLASATVAISGAVADCADPGNRGRVTVVHNGIDTPVFRPSPRNAAVRAALGGSDDAPLVGIVGRVDPEKGVDVVVRAMAELTGSAADARLVVVGNSSTAIGGYYEALCRDATELLGDRVRFVGVRTDIADVMRALDVLVNASVAEPFGLSVLEAQACGTPVVGTCAGGLPEFVEHGRTGLLVTPGDSESLAAALNQLAADPVLAGRLTAAARQQVERSYGLEVQADAIAAVYRRLARPVG